MTSFYAGPSAAATRAALATGAWIGYTPVVSDDLLRRFRIVAFLEGTSFLLLLCVAMPLKYLAGMPLAVRVVGMAHGILFVLYAVLVVALVVRKRWTLGRAAEAMALSLMPLGTFVLDRSIRRELTAPDPA